MVILMIMVIMKIMKNVTDHTDNDNNNDIIESLERVFTFLILRLPFRGYIHHFAATFHHAPCRLWILWVKAEAVKHPMDELELCRWPCHSQDENLLDGFDYEDWWNILGWSPTWAQHSDWNLVANHSHPGRRFAGPGPWGDELFFFCRSVGSKNSNCWVMAKG